MSTLEKINQFEIQAEIDVMKSAVLVAAGKFETQERPLPVPSKNQVRIKLEGCGLCASSIPVWQGREWFSYPREAGSPGHEGWGYIDAIGEEVKEYAVGERVAFLSDKSYAEYDLADDSALVKIPEALANMPFPGEPLGCAINIFNRADIKEGQTVAIVGIGFLGALLIQLAKNAGATVIALSQRDYSLDVAHENGADHILKLDDHWKIIAEVKELTNGKFCERVIEATGKEWPLNLSAELTGERGKLIIAGFHQDGMRQVNVQLWNWRGIDVINAHERDPQMYIKGMKEAMIQVMNGTLDPSRLYTHNFTIEELSEAFTMLSERPDGFVKALINF
ncbi:MAG TPA: zinc-binding dehydrogenase [Cytophagaceae bacterium]|jgi:threonine dehydrogenase-like Zn-dependent dehydrogenase